MRLIRSFSIATFIVMWVCSHAQTIPGQTHIRTLSRLWPAQAGSKKASDPSKQAPPTSSASPADDTDGNLAMAIEDITDAALMMDLLQAESQVPGSFKEGVDKRAPQMMVVMKEIQQLLALTSTSDPKRSAAKDENYKVAAALSAALEQAIDGYDAARKAGGWNKAASDLFNSGLTAASKLPFDGSTDKLVQDPTFQKSLSHIYLEAKGLIPDKSGFPLGINMFVGQSLYIINVKPNSLAAKLGLEAMEGIDEFDGQEPEDIDDLKQMIKKAAGKTVRIKVTPKFGDEKEFQVTVPAKLQP